MAKTDDPLAGVEANDWFCPICKKHFLNLPPPATHPGGKLVFNKEERKIDDEQCPGKFVRLLPEPAVRKAMVEWWRREANKFKGFSDDREGHDDWIRWDYLTAMADRLERGGGEG